MTQRLLHRLIAAAVFVISALQFLFTAQPSVSFWDPGELSAAAKLLQVPHPPGGPLFSLVGKVMYLLPIPGNIGFRMNLVSILASAFVVLLVYLVAVRLIRIVRKPGPETWLDTVGTCVAAAIGALGLSFCDTFWFNGVEANYFAASTLLFALMMWLIMIWHEHADQPGSTRYLLMIAYLVGLSSGVHLMSIPALFVIVMIVVFRMVPADDAAARRSAYIFAAHVVLLLLVAYGMWAGLTSKEPPSPDDLQGYDLRFVLIMAGVSAIVAVLFRKSVFSRDSIYLALAIGAVALAVAYPGVIKKLPQAIHSLSRDDNTLGVVLLFVVLAALGGLVYWSGKNRKSLLHLASLGTLFVVLGFTTYTMIVVRANVHPPMNENDPKSFSSLLTYLNREQYGDFPIFKRRWTTEQDRQRTYANYSSDFDFFIRYQMNHMFTRYVLFNFAGRTSHDQDADWTMRQLYGIPLLVGLFGLYWLFRYNWKLGTCFLILFVIMGYLIAFYQNQQEPQPRERDYFYSGAYFVFAIWIAVGIRALLDLALEFVRRPAPARLLGSSGAMVAVAAVLGLGMVFIPGRMAQTNYFTHDRSRNWIPREYAYNMLQTCEKDAVLFTNGDNDTFPLWYLQDVEGIRRDVRVVCLSLGNTNWYIQELKDKPYYPEARAVAMTLSDARIANIQPVLWEPRMMEIPVPRDVYARFGITDTADINRGKIQWRMPNTLQFGQTKAIRVQDILVLNVIQANNWQRPIYFAVTCSPDARLGLDQYMRFSGLAWKLIPVKGGQTAMGIDPQVLEANFMDEGTTFYTTPHYGYRLQSLADSTVYLDENEERSVEVFRTGFRALASYYADVERNPQKSGQVLDRLEKIIPASRVPMAIDEELDLALLYQRIGRTDRSDRLSAAIESQFASMTENGPASDPYLYAGMLQLYEARGENQKELDLLNTLVRLYPNDPSLKQRIDAVQARLGKPAAKQP